MTRRAMEGHEVGENYCRICPAVRDDVSLFLTGSTEDYVDNVARYQSSPVILENAKLLKECVDGKMTDGDKQNALSVLACNAPSGKARCPLPVLSHEWEQATASAASVHGAARDSQAPAGATEPARTFSAPLSIPPQDAPTPPR
eukprot:XP_022281842.1 uncharacterized protein LOC111098275 isoform X2 [Canis lupus familiaris]